MSDTGKNDRSDRSNQNERTDRSDRTHEPPETALEEVLREIENAETRTRNSDEQRRHRGEAGEAITPNTRAQKESEGD